ncbi:ABC transporter substrate-binding protein [Antribacter gilvus]|uniref:ABC transporter substrate-binding protein n=1 Tax=Antribacter gilvus TaxID=2304675 RepID=UPI000F7AB4BD|nr:ABC transporter substrate-binding protein [Antribacter gilvus]
MRRRMSLSVAAMTAAMTFLLAGCASTYAPPVAPSVGAAGEGAGDHLSPVTVGILPIVDVAPIYLGLDKGVFEKHGIALTIDKAANGRDIINNVLSRRWQFGFSNVTSVVEEGTKTSNVKIVAAGNFSSGDPARDFGAMVAMPGSQIGSIEDLEGKTVAVNAPKGINQSMVMEFMERAGGDPASIGFTAIGFGAMPAAIFAGQTEGEAPVPIQAAFLVEPHLSKAKALGAVEIPGTSYGALDPGLMVACYFASNDLLVTDPELVANFRAAMTESLEIAQADPEAARAILDEYTTIPPEVDKSTMVLPQWKPGIHKESAILLGGLATKFYGSQANPDSVLTD